MGMEQFGAVDTTQWNYIMRLIDTSDYFILVVAGRYGAIDCSDSEKISYTYKEFRYAREKGIPIICLLHSNPELLPVSKCESDPEIMKKLEAFKSELKEGRLISFYGDHNELVRKVSASIVKAKTLFLRPGWVRDDFSRSELELQNEIKRLNYDNEKLLNELKLLKDGLKESRGVSDYNFPAILDGILGTTFNYKLMDRNYRGNVEINHRKMFTIVARRIRNGSFSTTKNYDDLLDFLVSDIILSENPSLQHDLGTLKMSTVGISSFIGILLSYGLIEENSDKFNLTKRGLDIYIRLR